MKKAKFNAEQFVEKVTNFIRDIFEKTGKKHAVIALSGGIDSATSLSLTVLALGASNVTAVHLPYNENKISKEFSDSLEYAGVDYRVVSIERMVDVIKDEIITENTLQKERLGNIMARVRMITIFDLAKKMDALVIGTENLSEHLLGYYTRYGDEASDIEPLRSLYKTQVREVAKFLGVPGEIIKAKPTAGLWRGQTDEGQFGFSYDKADKVFQGDIDKISNRTIKKVMKFSKANEFKQNVPYIF